MTDIVLQNKHENLVSIFDRIQADLKKNYLNSEDLNFTPIALVNDLEIKDINEDIKTKIRFFKLSKFVYEKDVKISYKLKSVFTALHSLKAGLLFKVVSDGKSCSIYLGIKSSKKANDKAEAVIGALQGNFPGTAIENSKAISNEEVLALNLKVFGRAQEITSVIGIPSLKDKEEDQFIQGIENLILGMNGKAFTALFIADPISNETVNLTIDSYEQIYSVLSSEKEFVKTEGTNQSNSVSTGHSTSESQSNTRGTNDSTSTNSSPWIGRKFLNGLFGTGSKNSDSVSSFLEMIVNLPIDSLDLQYGTQIRLIQELLGKDPDFKMKLDLKTKAEGNKTKGTNESTSISNSTSTSENRSSSNGSSSSLQKTYSNKKVTRFLDQLDQQIERLEQGKGIGFWNIGAYFISDQSMNSEIAANIYNGIIKGADSNFETSALKKYSNLNELEMQSVKEYISRYEIPRLEGGRYLAQAITTDELVVQVNLPHKSVVGLDVIEIAPFGNNPLNNLNSKINIGKLYNYDKVFSNEIALDYNKFTSHVFVTGSTGSGKSNVTYNLLHKLYQKGIKFLVIEPAKGEYKDEFGNRKDVTVLGTNPQFTNLLKINPFEFPTNIHIYEHIDRFIEILNACWPMEAAMPNILKEALEHSYVEKGWFLEKSICVNDKLTYPTFHDLLISLEKVLDNSHFSAEVKSNYTGALVGRVKSLTNGLNKLIFTDDSIADEVLFDTNVIIDLSRVASSEAKALYMGIIFMKLNEYRIANKVGNNSDLKHITVIEEAHNLLKRTSSDQSMQDANLAGKSVEMISNAIAEMRTYGEGFIIADQAPGLLDMSVIRNTNTKICLRLPDFEDRKLIGNAMNLNEEQIKKLASLETGVAALYQNDWQEAILCKFDLFKNENSGFEFTPENKSNQAIDAIKNSLETGLISSKDAEKIAKELNLEWLLQINYNDKVTSNANKNIYINIIRKLNNITVEDSLLVLKYLIYKIEADGNNHSLLKIKKSIKL